jgi:hypothetical protein
MYKSAASIRAAVDASKPELGIVAGQSTQVVEAGGGHIVVRRVAEGAGGRLRDPAARHAALVQPD